MAGLVRQFRGPGAAAGALDAVRKHWHDTLGRVQVKTPEPAVDVLVNGWLMYQVIACRFWARSGYYQSGGAFGFRDQLQDSMAMVHATPHLARGHLLLCAAHQYPEGDVQHWWHPPIGRGVRTECSDDYLWLAVAASRYVHITGDLGVLDERVGYIEGRAVNPGEDSYYDLPGRSTLVETLYEHCKRAIQHGLTHGAHGLPLIGCGDWNDGMNRVGEQGRGESVWLGFFLYDVLLKFAETARAYDDSAFASYCRSQALELQVNLEAHGWDGEWYRRAYFDDGTPLGSASNDECRIDSIAQSWSVLSGAGADDRQRESMASLDRLLVKRDAGLIQLLDPPFDQSALDPGYIKGYVPGVRENGGQYTHAAIWAAMAFATLGDSKRAWELLRIINPVNHGTSAASIERYKVEPYVMTADVYGVSPHIGRGGWSWYTGSAGWMYRLLVESLLGLQVEGDRLRLAPLMPANWDSFELHYHHGNTLYHLKVTQPAGIESQFVVR
jgi:cyclic beta-1,2-glucan synthetase